MQPDPVHMAELRAARAQARLDALEAQARRRKAGRARKSDDPPSPRRELDAARPRRYELDQPERVNRLRRGLEATDPRGDTR